MRPTRDEWAIQMAGLTAQRGTCYRRQVGCVLLSPRGHVLATGYNGTAAGQPHCIDDLTVCPGSRAPSGTALDSCHAIHAEQNALLQCRNVYQIHTCYTTTSPCMTCTKLLLNTGCERVAFLDLYPQPEARQLWVGAGRKWEQLTLPVRKSGISVESSKQLKDILQGLTKQTCTQFCGLGGAHSFCAAHEGLRLLRD